MPANRSPRLAALTPPLRLRAALAAALVCLCLSAFQAAAPRRVQATPRSPQRTGQAAAIPLPVRLQIPSLQIDAPIIEVGSDDDGGMASPDSDSAVGWFAPGYLPGTPGNAVISGHVDWVDHAAVFWFLKNLSPGDTITVLFDDGSSVEFAVDAVQTYGEDDAPIDTIFGPSDGAHLNLVTCGGIFDTSTRDYDQRTVVYSTMVASTAAAGAALY